MILRHADRSNYALFGASALAVLLAASGCATRTNAARTPASSAGAADKMDCPQALQGFTRLAAGKDAPLAAGASDTTWIGSGPKIANAVAPAVDAASSAARDLATLLPGAKPEEISDIFSLLSHQDFRDFVARVKSNEIVLEPALRTRVLFAADLVARDPHSSFWQVVAPSDLEASYAKFVDLHLNRGVGSVLDNVDSYTTTELEKEMVATAVSNDKYGRIGRGSFLRRTFIGHYGPVKRLTEFNNFFRTKLDFGQELRKNLQAYLDTTPDILRTERDAIDKALIKVEQNRREAKEQSELSLYGRLTGTGGAHDTPQDINIFTIDKNIQKLMADTKLHNRAEPHELALEVVNDLDNTARAQLRRTAGRERVPRDYLPVELKVRHREHAGQASAARATLDTALQDGAPQQFRVHYHYEEIVTRYKSETRTVNGKSTQVQVAYDVYIPHSAVGDVTPSYQALLHDRLNSYHVGMTWPCPGRCRKSAVTRFEGIDQILRDSLPLSRREKPFVHEARDISAQAQSLFAKHREAIRTSGQPAIIVKQQQALSDLQDRLTRLMREWESFARSPAHEVRALWAQEVPARFAERNGAAYELMDSIWRQLKIYEEQWRRRETELEMVAALADYRKELDILYNKLVTNYAVTGAGAVTVGGVGYCEYSQIEQNNGHFPVACWQALMRSIFGGKTNTQETQQGAVRRSPE